MMSKMRNNTATILWILVFAFIATIIFSWGMGGFQGKYEPGVLAKVNGVKITRDHYDQALQNRLNYERQISQTGQLEDNRVTQLRNEVWDGLVNEILLNAARAKAGIVVSDREVAFAVQQNPPASIVNSPNFVDSTGQFDWDFYYAVLADPENVEFVVSLEENLRQQLLQQKMLGRIASVDHISEFEARSRYLEQNTKGIASYILVGIRDIPTDSTLITEAQLRSEYRSRLDEFKQVENRTVEIVTIPDVPSREDSLDARRLIEHLMERIEDGDSFEALAMEYSEDGSASEGGDLGWFGKGRMVKPFETAAFDAEIGKLVGPVETQFGYHLIRVDQQRLDESGQPEVKARHILVKIERSPETLDDIRNRADAFREEAEEQGFHKAARVFNLDVDTLTRVSRSGFIPTVGRNTAATEFLFNRPKGQVSPVYPHRQGFAVMRVISVQKESVKPFEEVRETLMKDLLKKQQIQRAGLRADSLHQVILSGVPFKEAAAGSGLDVRTTREFKVGEYIANVGREARFSVATLMMEEGEISSPIESDRGWYIVHLDSKSVPDMERWDRIRDEEIGKMYQQRQNQVLNAWIEMQRENAKIEDFRYLYYTEY